MSQDKINVLNDRNTNDAEMISLYKKQIAQLAACISDREGRIRRRVEVIGRLNLGLQREFNIRVGRAADDAKFNPVSVGDKYRDGQTHFEVVELKDDLIAVKYRDEDRYAVSGKDLEMLSKVFFFDHPNATKV